jgi:septum formation protein
MTIPFVLASASTARKRLLNTIGIEPVVSISNFDEDSIKITDPPSLVQELAIRKAKTVAAKHPNSLILGCDSVLAIDGEIHGKPHDAADALKRWQQMRGNYGILYTGHATIDTERDRQLVRCGVTYVYFANVSDSEIRAYVATGEPMYCAGAFALEGRGGAYVEKIDGCHSNVIGLSLPLLREMLFKLDRPLDSFW